MKYLVVLFSSFLSFYSIAQQVDSIGMDSTMIYIEQEFYAYDLPNSDSVYLDSVYRTEQTSSGIIGGVGYSDGGVIEFGYGKSFYGLAENRSSFQSFYGGVEILPNTNDEYMIAPKASIWIEESRYLTAVGLNVLYYTNFEGYTVRLRPEIGLGYRKMKLTYGHNFTVLKGNLTAVSKHNIGLSYFFDVKKQKAKVTTYQQYLEEQKEHYRNGMW